MEATILAMEHQAIDSVLKGDTARLKKLLADDFMGIGPNGRIKTKTELLDWAESRKFIYDSIKTSDIRVRVYGKTAVVTGTLEIKAHRDQKDIYVHVRYTRVWIKEQGRWQVVSFQATRIGPSFSEHTVRPETKMFIIPSYDDSLKIEEVIDHLDTDLGRALRETVAGVLPG